MKKMVMGIGLFQMGILHLISLGKKEKVEKIVDEMIEGSLVDYICNKYGKDGFSNFFVCGKYDDGEINRYFCNNACAGESHAEGAYGLANEDDGLLLILAVMISDMEHGLTA